MSTRRAEMEMDNMPTERRLEAGGYGDIFLLCFVLRVIVRFAVTYWGKVNRG